MFSLLPTPVPNLGIPIPTEVVSPEVVENEKKLQQILVLIKELRRRTWCKASRNLKELNETTDYDATKKIYDGVKLTIGKLEKGWDALCKKKLDEIYKLCK